MGEINVPLKVRMNLKKQPGSFETVNVFRINSDYNTLIKIDAQIENDHIAFETTKSGSYVAKNQYDYTILIVSMVGAAFLLVVIGAIGIFLQRNPKYIKRIRYTACNAKRSMSDQI